MLRVDAAPPAVLPRAAPDEELGQRMIDGIADRRPAFFQVADERRDRWILNHAAGVLGFAVIQSNPFVSTYLFGPKRHGKYCTVQNKCKYTIANRRIRQ